MNIIDGGITSAKGFKASGEHTGIKKSNKDMAVIISDKPCSASGCFTTNVVKASPVLWDIKNIKNKITGIVVNSGNANACTGEQGHKDTEQMADTLAKLTGVKKENILVCSTGVIGVNLPMDKVEEGIKKVYESADYSFEAGKSASEAIMTTDTYSKSVCVQFDINGKLVTMGGMAKGCGMINPNMATMLCFITTDAQISDKLVDKALKECIKDTFNMITVDGDTSTNDTVILLSNGMAENEEILFEDENYSKFKEALFYITKKLAIECVKDGEGATKLMEVTAKGIKNKDDARKIAHSVVSSNLFKAALFGEDANWGRVLCAMGYSGVSFNPEGVTIIFRSDFGKITLMESGKPIIFDEQLASSILSAHDIYIDIILNEGKEQATAWGCDLTYDYVKINGDYRS